MEVTSRRVTACQVTSCHVMSRDTSWHGTACHVMSVAWHVESGHVMSRPIISCHGMACQVLLCDVRSRPVTSRHVMSCHVTSLTSRRVVVSCEQRRLYGRYPYRSLSKGGSHGCCASRGRLRVFRRVCAKKARFESLGWSFFKFQTVEASGSGSVGYYMV